MKNDIDVAIDILHEAEVRFCQKERFKDVICVLEQAAKVDTKATMNWVDLWRLSADCENTDHDPQDDFCHCCWAHRTTENPDKYTNKNCRITYDKLKALIESIPGE